MEKSWTKEMNAKQVLELEFFWLTYVYIFC